MKSFIIFIMGPTCVGKSSLAIKLYEDIPIDIISVDACMVYNYMDIGTGKPDKNELYVCKHFLVNILDPSNIYSVGNFCRDSCVIINNSFRNNKIPCFIGGSLMYFWYLYYSLYFVSFYRKFLCDFDKYKYNNSYNDFNEFYCYMMKNRLIKSNYLFIKFFKCSFIKDMLDKFKICNNFVKFDIKIFSIIPINKNDLYFRIKTRFYNMMKCGFLDEVGYLYNRGDLNQKHPSMRSIGYRHMWEYFDGVSTFNETKDSILQATNHLVKKQITWLKKWKNNICYIESYDNDIIGKIKTFLV